MHIPYATTGPLDLDHTRITCLEFFQNDTDTHALVMCQDTRHPQQYPTTILQAQWTRLPGGRVCTIMTPHTIKTPPRTRLTITTPAPNDHPHYLMYHVDTIGWPTCIQDVGPMLIASYTAMLATHATPPYISLIQDLGIAMSHVIDRAIKTGSITHDIRHIHHMFWRLNNVYSYASHAVRGEYGTPYIVRTITLVNLPTIALLTPNDTQSIIWDTLDREYETCSNTISPDDVPFLQSYTLIPIHDAVIPIVLSNDINPSQHTQLNRLRKDLPAIERVRQYFYPQDVDPILGTLRQYLE